MATRMPARKTEQTEAMHFPLAGIDLSAALERQPARPVAGGMYARTTPSAVNVRGFEAGSLRNRGGSRAGLKKYIPTPVVAGWIIQHIDILVSSYNPGGGVQQSNSGRVVTLVAVSQGNVYTAAAGALVWTAATNASSGTPPLNFTGIVRSTVLGQKMYFADGVNAVYYDPITNTVYDWVATAGSLPVDSSGNRPRLIETWRGSIVQAGLLKDPHNFFISAVDDATDWNTSPISITPAEAFDGHTGSQGLVGDVITGLVPFTDDNLLVGCDHELHLFSGDPRAGGSIDAVSRSIGMAWGEAWCMDPNGTLYFLSNRTGVYRMSPRQKPQRISQPIEQLLLPIDTGNSGVRLEWNDRFQGLNIFVTPLDEPEVTTHFFWEERSGAWWKDQFANTNHNPLACCVFDGNDPNDRVVLVGGWDGYVRSIDPDATDDDGTKISSEVLFGPILTATTDDMLLKELQPVLGELSGEVTFRVYRGRTAEEALASTPVQTGVWGAGRGPTNLARWRGHAIYVGVSSTNPWAMETIRAVIDTLGKVGQRRQY